MSDNVFIVMKDGKEFWHEGPYTVENRKVILDRGAGQLQTIDLLKASYVAFTDSGRWRARGRYLWAAIGDVLFKT